MKLTRLEIYGFKSFPQRTDIRFDDGITGIVGPNGSGKSNIADAVRWVLGEQSAKALRGAKMEDVIFAGTQKRRLMPYCEVSLIFDNADGQLKNPHTEVMVTRRAYRTGEGEYYLNKKSCRLRDIVELFHDTGIGREGYSLIGQGHIDVILSGRGDERRAAFEEAAGISGYRARKEESERKLARTQEHLLRVSDLLEELGARLIPLQEQSETARSYLALMAQLKTLDANIFINRHGRLSARIASLEEAQQSIAQQIAEHEAQLAAQLDSRAEVDAALVEAEADSDQLSQQLSEQEARLREQAVQAERSAQSLRNAQTEAETIHSSLRDLHTEITELTALLAGSAQEGEQSEGLLQEADAQLASLEAGHEAAANTLFTAEERLDSHRSRLLQAANSRLDLRERRARQQAMLAQAKQRQVEVDGSLETLMVEENQAKQDEQQAQERLAATRAGVQALMDSLAQAQRAQQEQEAQLSRQTADLQEARLNFQRDKARLSTMEDMSRTHEGFGQAVRQALLRGEGNPKILGPLAQLISVPQELETAMEMVLGGALQHIVTEDEETAQELINHLRAQRLGRTTFLPLSAVRGRSLNQQELGALRLPGCLGLASELIGYEGRLRGVVESLLGRTLVARDLDAAIAISRFGRQAFHVVTLQGDVMRAGGAMTGGSIQSRTVSLLGREREIKELGTALNDKAQDLLKMEASLLKLQEEVKALSQAVRAQQLHAQDEEIGIAREEEQLSRAQERLATIQNRLQQAQSASNQLSEMIDQLQQDLRLAEEDNQLSDSGQAQMEQEGEALHQAMLQAREQAEAAMQALQEKREARTALAHRLDLFTRDRQRLEKELQRLQARQAQQESALQSNATKIQAEQLNATALAAQAEEQEKGVQALRIRAADAMAHRRELSARQSHLMDQSEQIHKRHTEDSQRLHKGELSLTRLQEELHSITQTLWNTHELTYALAEALLVEGRFDLPAGEREAAAIRSTIKEMGAINIHALDEYAATKTRFDDLSLQRDDAQQAREDLIALIKRLQGQMEKQFVRELALLNEYFAETFKRLFNGGQASLSLADPSQPLDCEIQIKAQPPGKKLQLLSLLSGGERTLTAIAILFAMLKLKPTPFCILDEIEAALDDANIVNFAQYLAEYKQDTQFIVITHRKGTMESCDMLYGVTMREKGVSDMISINLEEYTA